MHTGFLSLTITSNRHCLGSYPAREGFTLTELAVVLLIVALLIGGLLMPLSTQVDSRNQADTQKTLNAISEALLGFAAANGRLPCPASALSSGQESFAVGGDASNGNCSNFYDGFVPAATLGLTPTDQSGFVIDAWGQRIRYAVYSGTIATVSNPFTRSNGIRLATMSSISGATLLSICTTATGIGSSNCGTAPKLTDKTPVALFSQGKNGASGGAGTDELANLNGDAVIHFSCASACWRHQRGIRRHHDLDIPEYFV